LYQVNSSSFLLNPWLIAIVSICVIAFLILVINRVIRAHRRQVATGREELIGKTAVVKIALEPKGVVSIQGERWIAIADKGLVKPGEEVLISKVERLTLYVTKKE